MILKEQNLNNAIEYMKVCQKRCSQTQCLFSLVRSAYYHQNKSCIKRVILLEQIEHLKEWLSLKKIYFTKRRELQKQIFSLQCAIKYSKKKLNKKN